MDPNLNVKAQLATAKSEQKLAEAHAADAKAKLKAMADLKSECDMEGRTFTKTQQKAFDALRSECSEARKIAEARAERVRELYKLLVTTELADAKKFQKKFIQEVIREAESIRAGLERVHAGREQFLALLDEEMLYARGVNRNLDVQPPYALREIIRNHTGILPPFFRLDAWLERFDRELLSLRSELQDLG